MKFYGYMGYGLGTNQLNFGTDLDPGLDSGSIFPFFEDGEIGLFRY